MTSQEFTFWLRGFLSDKNELTLEQIEFVQRKMEEIKDPITSPAPAFPLPYEPTNPHPLNPPYVPTCPAYPGTWPDIWYTTSTDGTSNMNLDDEMDQKDTESKED